MVKARMRMKKMLKNLAHHLTPHLSETFTWPLVKHLSSSYVIHTTHPLIITPQNTLEIVCVCLFHATTTTTTDDLDSNTGSYMMPNYKEWKEIIFTFTNNSLQNNANLNKKKRRKLFQKCCFYLSHPPQNLSRGPPQACVFKTEHSQPIRAQYLLEYCFSWMRSWCEL